MVDQGRDLRRGLHKEPRIHADAVPANPRPGIEDVDARVTVGQADGLPHIHAKFFGKTGKLVGNGDVYVAGGVLHQLDHLGCGCIGLDDVAFDKERIQVAACP